MCKNAKNIKNGREVAHIVACIVVDQEIKAEMRVFQRQSINQSINNSFILSLYFIYCIKC